MSSIQPRTAQGNDILEEFLNENKNPSLEQMMSFIEKHPKLGVGFVLEVYQKIGSVFEQYENLRKDYEDLKKKNEKLRVFNQMLLPKLRADAPIVELDKLRAQSVELAKSFEENLGKYKQKIIELQQKVNESLIQQSDYAAIQSDNLTKNKEISSKVFF